MHEPAWQEAWGRTLFEEREREVHEGLIGEKGGGALVARHPRLELALEEVRQRRRFARVQQLPQPLRLGARRLVRHVLQLHVRRLLGDTIVHLVQRAHHEAQQLVRVVLSAVAELCPLQKSNTVSITHHVPAAESQRLV